MIVIAILFRKLKNVKDLVRPLFKKHRFRNSFHNQHFKESQTLVKSAGEHFCDISSSILETVILEISPLLSLKATIFSDLIVPFLEYT